jgi:calcium-dependent protein kinase
MKNYFLDRIKNLLGLEDKRTNTLRGNFIQKHCTPIEDDFSFGYDEAPIGEGSFGVVRRGMLRKNNRNFAIKVLAKVGNLTRIEREIALLTDIDHVHIIRLFSVYESPDCVSVVFDLCTGGHLGDWAAKAPNKQLSEETANIIIRQLTSAVAHIHSLGICHRDIKLQNILLDNMDDTCPQIKLIDFGFAIRFEGALPLQTRCGTTYCTAPEVFRECYDERCDMWSIGVVAYILLSGHRPFTALAVPGSAQSEKAAIVTNILMARYHFNYFIFKTVSAQAISFIRKMFEPNYAVRCTSQAALSLPWLTKTGPSARTPPSASALAPMSTPLSAAVSTLCKKRNASRMGNTGMVAVAFNNSRNGAPELRSLFQDFDTENRGYLSKKSFRTAMKSVSPDLSSADIDSLFEAIDVDNDKQISFTEFLAATLDPRALDVEELGKAFALLDSDAKGYLTVNDFYRVLAVTPDKYKMFKLSKSDGIKGKEDSSISPCKAMEVKGNAKKNLLGKILEMVASADTNEDGVISYEEFLLGVIGVSHEDEETDQLSEMNNRSVGAFNELDELAINRSTDMFCSNLSSHSGGFLNDNTTQRGRSFKMGCSQKFRKVNKSSSVIPVSKSCPTNLQALGAGPGPVARLMTSISTGMLAANGRGSGSGSGESFALDVASPDVHDYDMYGDSNGYGNESGSGSSSGSGSRSKVLKASKVVVPHRLTPILDNSPGRPGRKTSTKHRTVENLA